MGTFTLAIPEDRHPPTASSGRFHALYTFREGGETRHLVLPVDGCPGEVGGDVPASMQGPAGEHIWTMPINCLAHDYAHRAGIGCQKCGEHHFFVKPFCPDEEASQ